LGKQKKERRKTRTLKNPNLTKGGDRNFLKESGNGERKRGKRNLTKNLPCCSEEKKKSCKERDGKAICK